MRYTGKRVLFHSFMIFLFLLSILIVPSEANPQITNPKEHFGHDIGEDYWLASYTEAIAYWKRLEAESERLVLEEIGITEEGRAMMMAIITSPENHKNLNRFKQITKRLALAEGLTDTQAKDLASQGKAVVWIDGGLHATEVVGAQQEIELVYHMVNSHDPEVLRILDNVILLALFTNPDGMDMVAEWYLREKDPAKRSTSGLPRLYQKYVGHDNNRDFYMVTQKETEAVNRILYAEWFPQIIYNHHQTGPAGSVLFAPPFRDPHSYNLDPLLVLGITMVGNAMHSRFAVEGKPGATMREGGRYQTWWNGCLRGTPYFHNMIGILTEMKGNPTPVEIPFIPEKQLPDGDYPYPIAPQKWHFRQSIEYSMTANLAILDLAAKHREDFLNNIYRMGKNSIEKGSRDNWTLNPRRIEAVLAAIEKDKAKKVGTGKSQGYPPKYFHQVLHDPAFRDARGYIIPSSQTDFLTAGKFVNTLLKNGITVLRASQSFQVKAKSYPQGSYVIKTAQAFRPHVVDMFEPQHYPDDTLYPGGPPQPPYDSAGYTLAIQMGIKFDRVLDDFEGPFEKITGLVEPSPGQIRGNGTSGYLLSHGVNDAFVAINRLLKSGEKIYWLKEPFVLEEKTYPVGTIYVPKVDSTANKVERLAKEIGLNFEAIDIRPRGQALALKPLRIGLWDRYGGSMDSGWIRWLFEKFEFDFDLVFPQMLDAGDLIQKFDVLIFVNRGIPEKNPDPNEQSRSFLSPEPKTIPAAYRHMLGSVTQKRTIPQLVRFLEHGGTILTIGSSTNLAFYLNLPLADALVEKSPEGKEVPVPQEKYFIPGSILRVRVDNSHPLAYGMSEEVDVYFNQSPVFKLLPKALMKNIRPVAWFDRDASLRSGWATGQHYLKGNISVLEVVVGKGKLFLFGPEITFRAQPHGTFKFLFNGIYYGGAEAITLHE